MGELDNPSSGEDEARRDTPEHAGQPTGGGQPGREAPERQPAETRTREEYASHLREQGAPAPASDRPAQTPAAQQEAGQARGRGAEHRAEPRDRESYAGDIRATGSQDTHRATASQERDADPAGQPASQPGITHYHGDFKGQHMDLYTDGIRWAPGDRVQGENVVGEKPEKPPGDISDLPPSGEQLRDEAEESGTRAERLRKKLYQEFGDVTGSADDLANTVAEYLKQPPAAGKAEVHHADPVHETPQHATPDAGTIAELGFVLGVIGIETTRWARHRLSELGEREKDGSQRRADGDLPRPAGG